MNHKPMELSWVESDLAEWAPTEWALVCEGFRDFAAGAQWDESILAHALVRSGQHRLVLRRMRANSTVGAISALAYEITDELRCIEFYDLCFNGFDSKFHDAPLCARETIVHELAHIWDMVHGLRLSRQMMRCTASSYLRVPGTDFGRYRPKGNSAFDGATKCGHISHVEDFAEAVAASVYGPSYLESQGQYVDEQRLQFVSDRFAYERSCYAAGIKGS